MIHAIFLIFRRSTLKVINPAKEPNFARISLYWRLFDERLFYYLQGGELIHIYEIALSNYTINFTKLFSYAKRREKEYDRKQLMSNNMLQLVKDIIED